MYLLTSINVQECGYEIIEANVSKEMCEEAHEKLRDKVWHNEDGTRKAFSNIYDDTRAKNAFICTNRRAEELFGGKANLDMAIEFLREDEMIEEDMAEGYEKYGM